MYCLIGPCLSKKHLEVQDDVINQVKKMNFDTSPFYQKTDETHYLLDNKGLNKQQLLNLGVLEENILLIVQMKIMIYSFHIVSIMMVKEM